MPLHSLRFGDTALTPAGTTSLPETRPSYSGSTSGSLARAPPSPWTLSFALGDPTELAIAVTGSSHTVKTARRDFEDGDLSGFEDLPPGLYHFHEYRLSLKGEKSLR